jgi:hypothetical protein
MSLWAACFLTILIETALLALFGKRSAGFITVCVCANAATNLAINLSTGRLLELVDITYFIYVLESAAAAAEYAVYSLLEGRSRRLFCLTLAANVLSYGAGLLIYGHI